mmetsp:Transcript_31134/g.74010  ORF Transcript_31134/g.74010 Transcript_31134/m.74010 type:complete len:231 (-) Transcript_31134:750-1442(-)
MAASSRSQWRRGRNRAGPSTSRRQSASPSRSTPRHGHSSTLWAGARLRAGATQRASSSAAWCSLVGTSRWSRSRTTRATAKVGTTRTVRAVRTARRAATPSSPTGRRQPGPWPTRMRLTSRRTRLRRRRKNLRRACRAGAAGAALEAVRGPRACCPTPLTSRRLRSSSRGRPGRRRTRWQMSTSPRTFGASAVPMRTATSSSWWTTSAFLHTGSCWRPRARSSMQCCKGA